MILNEHFHYCVMKNNKYVSKQIVHSQDTDKKATVFIFRQSVGRYEGRVDRNLGRKVLREKQLSVSQDSIISLIYCKLTTVKFDFTSIYDMVIPLDQQVDLHSMGVIAAFGPCRMCCADSADSKSLFNLINMIKADMLKQKEHNESQNRSRPGHSGWKK